MIYVSGFFKVTNKYFQSDQYDFLNGHGIQYKMNEWIYPKEPKSKLFVFDTLKHAKSFKNERPIFLCEVINPSKISERLFINSVSHFIKAFWTNQYVQDTTITTRLPHGTYGVQAVRLIERIQ